MGGDTEEQLLREVRGGAAEDKVQVHEGDDG